MTQQLLDLGYSIIPIATGTKRPRGRWATYQTRVATPEEVQSWGELAAVGIVTGFLSGVVVVDCDDAEAVAWAEANLPHTPARVRTGGGGLHLYYRHPGGRVPNRAKARGLRIDVRGDGGQVLAPGSQHPSGSTYQAVGELRQAAELPVYDPAWLG